MTKHTDVIARNKAVVRAYYDGAERGDISGFGGFLHADFEVHAPNYCLGEARIEAPRLSCK